MNIDVIIPVFRPTDELEKMLKAIRMQTYKADHIIIMHTEDGKDLKWMHEVSGGIPVIERTVRPQEFDHGHTRDIAIRSSNADIVILMTQDAVPLNRYLFENLTKALVNEENAAVSYARQIPDKEADLIEKCARKFNYPAQSAVKKKSDVRTMGIKAYFCSNVCAAYRREIYLQLGGFEQNIIFNEDMVYAAKAMEREYSIVYAADAVVKHSHNYSGLQQMKRNFDLGVSHACYPEIFENISSESEGMRLVKETAAYLLRKRRPLQIVRLLTQSFCKYAGYILGKNYRKLPAEMRKRMTMNQNYWERKIDANE